MTRVYAPHDGTADAIARDAARATLAPTERQVSFLTSLATERGLDAAELLAAAGNRDGVSREIDRLLAIPRPRREAAPRFAPIADGYYAVEYLDVLRFYALVTRESHGGRQFVNRFRSDDLGRVGTAEAHAVRDAIRRDPAAAAMRFAAESVRCYKCARRLTDADSRAAGMGPDCRSRA